MAFELTSESGSTMRFGGEAWSLLLGLAESYGWKPAGTMPPEGDEPESWSGDYDTNDGQRVTAQDAAAIAAALSAALADSRRAERQTVISRALDRAMHRMEVEAYGEEEVGPYVEREPRLVSDDVLRDFVAFLKGGSFQID